MPEFPFAVECIQKGISTRALQQSLGHKDVETTMIYTQHHNRRGKGVKNPVGDL